MHWSHQPNLPDYPNATSNQILFEVESHALEIFPFPIVSHYHVHVIDIIELRFIWNSSGPVAPSRLRIARIDSLFRFCSSPGRWPTSWWRRGDGTKTTTPSGWSSPPTGVSSSSQSAAWWWRQARRTTSADRPGTTCFTVKYATDVHLIWFYLFILFKIYRLLRHWLFSR